MKKTMNDIFDEAKANEIEALVNKNALPNVSDKTLSLVKGKVYAKTGIAETKKKKTILFYLPAIAVAACLCLTMVVIWFGTGIFDFGSAVSNGGADQDYGENPNNGTVSGPQNGALGGNSGQGEKETVTRVMTIVKTSASAPAFEYKDGNPYCFYAYDANEEVYRVLWSNFEGLNEQDRIIVEYSLLKKIDEVNLPGAWGVQNEISALNVIRLSDEFYSPFTLTCKFEDGRIQTLLGYESDLIVNILKKATWSDDVPKQSHDYTMTFGALDIYYCSEFGIFWDVKNQRQFEVGAKVRAFINKELDNAVNHDDDTSDNGPFEDEEILVRYSSVFVDEVIQIKLNASGKQLLAEILENDVQWESGLYDCDWQCIFEGAGLNLSYCDDCHRITDNNRSRQLNMSEQGKLEQLYLDNGLPVELAVLEKGAILVVNESYNLSDYIFTLASEVAYESVDPEIATVDENGCITAKDIGKTSIRVYVVVKGNRYLSNFFEVMVKEPDPISMEILNAKENLSRFEAFEWHSLYNLHHMPQYNERGDEVTDSGPVEIWNDTLQIEFVISNSELYVRNEEEENYYFDVYYCPYDSESYVGYTKVTLQAWSVYRNYNDRSIYMCKFYDQLFSENGGMIEGQLYKTVVVARKGDQQIGYGENEFTWSNSCQIFTEYAENHPEIIK